MRFVDQDPLWINNKIRKRIHEKNDFNNELETILKKLQCLQKQVINVIKTAKEQFLKRISKELLNLSTIPKTYWSILV